MAEKGSFRGLLGRYINDEEDRCDGLNLPDGYVPGIGLGATEDAKRWAAKGMRAEELNVLKAVLKRPAHRPKKPKNEDVDSIRARAAYDMVQHIKSLRPEWRDLDGIAIANRHIIELIQMVESKLQIDEAEKIFPRTTSRRALENSLSLGKQKLGIDRLWRKTVHE